MYEEKGEYIPNSSGGICFTRILSQNPFSSVDLLFVSNVGVINQEEMTIKNWGSKTRTRLFDHGGMQEETKKVDPYDTKAGTGVLGRAKDILAKNGHNVQTLGINGSCGDNS